MQSSQELRTQNLRIRGTDPLISPKELKDEFPISEAAAKTVVAHREILQKIISGEDSRPVAIVGPCSIHNTDLGLEYAQKLKTLADEVQGQIFVIMRVYFEKPRTTVGWKGLINDPHMNDTFDINTGLRRARKLLLDINEIGLSAATELLEPVTPQYIADLITLGAVGARTTESPTHRQMASGLSMPVGFKNGTDGSLQSALDALLSAKTEHSFLGIDDDGRTCIVNTAGNPWGHLMLRGGRSGPNFDADSINSAAERLESAGLTPKMIVDCSHANSNKDYTRQSVAWNDVIGQKAAGNASIMGLMLESNLKAGNQKLTDPSNLEHGVSITDGCIDFEETEQLLRTAAATLAG